MYFIKLENFLKLLKVIFYWLVLKYFSSVHALQFESTFLIQEFTDFTIIRLT